MPTPVSSARQCLAGEAACALDEAVAVARRRAHAQTTSLHVVSALLSSSSPSLLRDALSRARSSAYSPRLQFKALELCFGVALDRLPSSHQHQAAPPDEPPVSNSLMAAVKRSQANQRRNPDTFHLYHHHQQQQQQQQQQQGSSSPSSSSSSFAGVKVELQQLVLSILDDPIVSRVFGEAGFRSCDIKLAVLRPPPSILRFPRAARCPPLFLCNFSAADDFAPRGFNFPFPGQLCSDGADENCRRIGEVLARRSSRNPMLVGVGAGEAARDFAQAVEKQNWAVLPAEIRGLRLVSIEGEVSELTRLDARLEELGRRPEEPGVVVSIGDLKGLVDGCDASANSVVSELTSLLELHRGKLWVMGSAASYETYIKFLSRYPSLDKDWDLQLLPITSVRPGSGGLFPRPHSLMESFVPFGGFFPTATESKGPLSSPYRSTLRCHYCNGKYEEEVAALKGCAVSAVEQPQANLPPWLQKAEPVSTNKGLDGSKAKDDKTVLNAKVMDLQKKWNDYCQHLHRGCPMLDTDNYSVGAEVLPRIVGLPNFSGKERNSNQNSKNPDVTQNQSGWGNAFPTAVGLPKVTSASQSMSLPLVSEPKDKNLLSKLQLRLSKSEQLHTVGFQSHPGESDLGMPDDHTSPSSVTSVTTDLALGTLNEPLCKEKTPASQIRSHTERLQDFSGCLPPKKADVIGRNFPKVLGQSYPCSAYPDSFVEGTYLHLQAGSKVANSGVSAFDQRGLSSSNMCEQFDLTDFKTLFRNLTDKVGRQAEAICAISQTVVRCKEGNERRRGASLKGDIWLSFLGPDRVGKKRTAAALAELLFGSRENLICIDLSFQDGIIRSNKICDRQDFNDYEVQFRGKTVVDHIAEEVSKKPRSVVFLENVDKADMLVQSSLSQAIQTGKFSDSHGREFSINNSVFVTTSRTTRNKAISPVKECANFSEERILAAQGCQMKILMEPISEAINNNPNVNVSITSRKEKCSVFVSKRKLNLSDYCTGQQESFGTVKRTHKKPNTFLDLNLPVEEVVVNDADCSSSSEESNSVSDSSEAWVDDFYDLMDETVIFRPFDFDALADNILKEISKSFRNTIGSESTLEIDTKAMEQILAATWLLENTGSLNNWFEKVLCRSFIEARQRYNLSTRIFLRLVTCEDAFMEEHAPGVLLPSRIILN